ncbi:hypothetical protein BaRGS_00037157 [Batillaria attramentaria]|uniref:Secreted protein n=1 Tax=Batillaria attramentaria TaxID=370345 RepID=A0ABD0JAE8_9CAEN
MTNKPVPGCGRLALSGQLSVIVASLTVVIRMLGSGQHLTKCRRIHAPDCPSCVRFGSALFTQGRQECQSERQTSRLGVLSYR